MAKLKGKKIVHLHLGSAYGKEPNSIFQKQAEKYGFEAKIIEVPAPGSEQQAQWLEIRQFKPDWVIVTGLGSDDPGDRSRTRRGWASRWTTSSGTSGPARRRTWSRWVRRPRATSARRSIPPGKEFKVIQDIERVVYGAGKGNMTDKNRVGSIYLQPRGAHRHRHGRGDPGGAGQVRQEAAHRRAGPLGTGEPQARRRAASRHWGRPTSSSRSR